jgi:hypothetical protein
MTTFKDSHSSTYRPAVASDFPDGKYVRGYFVKSENAPDPTDEPKNARERRKALRAARRASKIAAKSEKGEQAAS